MMRRVLKPALVVYLAAIAIACASFPQTIWRETKRDLRGILVLPLSPILLPAVARSYWQFVRHGAWPFGRNPQAVMLSDLIADRGTEGTPGHREIVLDLTPQLQDGKEGRLLYALEAESAYVMRTGAFAPARIDRPLVRVGQYFCMATEANGRMIWLSDRYECLRLIDTGRATYQLQKLGEQRGQTVLVK